MSYWQNKTVLVTGADGFLGTNLIRDLLSRQAKIVTFSRQGISSKSLLNREGLTGQLAAQELGTVEDLDRVMEVVKQHKIEIIYHLAALPLVEIGQANPVQTFQVNVAGTWNVLEAARQNQVEKTIAVSTAHVYGDNPNLPFQEAYYPQPSRPYETSKACADLIAQSYADSFGLDVEIPRFVNIYGPGDLNFNRLVPKVIKTVLSGENPRLWDSGAVRDFLYVDDAISALRSLAEIKLSTKKRNRIFNFGSGQPVKIVDLANQIVELAGGSKVKLIKEAPPEDRAKEILEQYVSIEKAQNELGWKPTVLLNDGLARTIDWYRTHQ